MGMTMFCSKFGMEIAKGMKFCTDCRTLTFSFFGFTGGFAPYKAINKEGVLR
jgi:hypothetical protein